MRKKRLAKEILDYFEKIAPSIVKESVKRRTTENPKIDLYDEDFYLNQIKEHYHEIDAETIKNIILENKLKIDDIFLENYKFQKEQ